MSTIWSRRALNRSFCPLSRRSLGRIESPSAKPTERQNHDQTPRSICKKSSQQTLHSCKCNDLPTFANPSKIRRIRILHRRLHTPMQPEREISESERKKKKVNSLSFGFFRF